MRLPAFLTTIKIPILLKYPMKTTYLVILIMITLVIIFVAIWIGLYMARELTVPVERLVFMGPRQSELGPDVPVRDRSR